MLEREGDLRELATDVLYPFRKGISKSSLEAGNVWLCGQKRVWNPHREKQKEESTGGEKGICQQLRVYTNNSVKNF